MIVYKNATQEVVAVRIPGSLPAEAVLRPGEIIQIPEGYGLPRRKKNGGKFPPIVKMLAPQLQPATDDDKRRVAGEYAEDWAPRNRKPNAAVKDALRALGYNADIAKSLSDSQAVDMLRLMRDVAAAGAAKVAATTRPPQQTETEIAAEVAALAQSYGLDGGVPEGIDPLDLVQASIDRKAIAADKKKGKG